MSDCIFCDIVADDRPLTINGRQRPYRAIHPVNSG